MPTADRMADRVGSQLINLTAVRRHDPYVADIVDSATQVAVYEYSSEASEWVSPPSSSLLILEGESAGVGMGGEVAVYEYSSEASEWVSPPSSSLLILEGESAGVGMGGEVAVYEFSSEASEWVSSLRLPVVVGGGRGRVSGYRVGTGRGISEVFRSRLHGLSACVVVKHLK